MSKVKSRRRHFPRRSIAPAHFRETLFHGDSNELGINSLSQIRNARGLKSVAVQLSPLEKALDKAISKTRTQER